MSSGLRVGRHAHIRLTLASTSFQLMIGARLSVIDADEQRVHCIWAGGRRTAIIMADMPRPHGGKGKDQTGNVGTDDKVAQHKNDGYLQPSGEGHVQPPDLRPGEGQDENCVVAVRPSHQGRARAGLAIGEDVGQGASPKELDPVNASPRLGLEEIEAPICLDRDADNLDTCTWSARRPNTMTEPTYTCRQRRRQRSR